MSNQVPSIYESFNARTLTNEQLCGSFIISADFQELASANHTIMIGPRGSGKTTLMRMLQVEALDIWNDDQAPSYRNNVHFSGVFIPTDRLWKTQYQKIKARSQSNEKLKTLLIATFTYHTLERLASALEYRTKRSKNKFKPVSLSKNDETELVTELADLWKVKPKIPSLRSLEISVTSKKKVVTDYITKIEHNISTDSPPPESIEGDIATILGTTTRVINTYINERGHKWAFLFDELELAPEEIIQPLVDAMRGGPDDLILKLSLSPYHKDLSVTGSPDSSMNNQDLSFINLTGKSDISGLDFSTRLCQSIFRRHKLNKDISEYFQSPKKIESKAIFKELASKDSTFKEYINKIKVEIEEIDNYTEKDKGPTVRKIKFVAYLRNYYIKKEGKASRKRCPDYYAGFPNLCKAMEYNPRMLIGLMNKLVPTARADGEISISTQIKYLSEIYDSYTALLSTIAIDSDSIKLNTIFNLIEVVANRFSDEIKGTSFLPEPKGTLTFKKEDNVSFLDAVGLALNAGALIIDRDSDEPFLNIKDIRNARCRLSYIFAHKYNLLLTKPREIELSDLLSETNQDITQLKAVKPDSTTPSGQMDLI